MKTIQEIEAEVYLGDGLYARFDGFSIVLRAPREGGDHWVVLEPQIIKAFEDYRACLNKNIAEYNKAFARPDA